MSRKPNPTAIGAFVLAAIAVAAIGALSFGSGKFFRATQPCVLFFESSLGGLDVGAPVEYGGVPVGSVTGIKLVYNLSDDSIRIPVYIELEPDRLTYTGQSSQKRDIEHLISHGLRAQLQSQSMLTGKLKIMLVESPDTPPRLIGGTDIQEIPTMLTASDELRRQLGDMPIMKIMENIHTATESLATILASESITNSLDNLAVTLASANTVLQQVKPGIDKLGTVLPELRTALGRSNESVQRTLGSIDKTLAELERLLEADSPVRYQMKGALTEITAAAESMRLLLDYLQMHPEALLSGKDAKGN